MMSPGNFINTFGELGAALPAAGVLRRAGNALTPSASIRGPPSPKRDASGHRLRRARATCAPWRSPEASPASMRMTGRPVMPLPESEASVEIPD